MSGSGGRGPRKARQVETRMAGPDHAVTTVASSHGAYRREVCPECPWRKDAPVGAFPAEAFRISAPTAYDMADRTFACHMAGTERTQVCAGFLMAQGGHNLNVRIACMGGRIDLSAVRKTVPTYRSYREMAVANGVAPDDPALTRCRDDGQVSVGRGRKP